MHSLPSLHDVLQYLEILACGISFIALCLWYLTRYEKSANERENKGYEESRLYPD